MVAREFSRRVFEELHRRRYWKTLEQTALGAPGLGEYGEKVGKNGVGEGVAPKRMVTESCGKERKDYLQKMSKEVLVKSNYLLDHQKPRHN